MAKRTTRKNKNTLTGSAIRAAYDASAAERIGRHLTPIAPPRDRIRDLRCRIKYLNWKLKHVGRQATHHRPSRPRFRMLRMLYGLARRWMPDEKIAERLGLTGDAFAAIKNDDPAVTETIRAARVAAEQRLMSILETRAAEGNVTAVRQLLAQFDAVQERKGTDLRRLTVRDLCRLTGQTAHQVDYWYRKHAMPKNPIDGTVDLGAFFAWYEKFIVDQHSFDPNRVRQIELEPFLGVTRQTVAQWTAAGLPRNADGTYSLAAVFKWRTDQLASRTEKNAEPVNPLTAEKVRKLQREHDVAMRNLLDRGEVMSGQAARLRAVVNFMDRKAGEAGTALEGATADAITVYVEKLFDAIRDVLKQVPDELQLPEDAAAAFGDCLRILADRDGSTDFTDDTD